jgi:thiol-disulfide isomerase/thioredoxin
MRIFTLILFAYTLLFSYDKGDTLSDSVVQKLQLKSEKIYVIDFFASWCHSCEKEMPHLSHLNSTLDKNRYEIIGVDVDKDTSKAKAFQKKMRDLNKLNFRVVNDSKGEIIKQFKPIGMPSLYIVQNLKVKDMIFGAIDGIDTIVDEKLKELQ